MSPALDLQQAVVATLGGDAALAALVGDRIHDAPPRAAVFPYLALGDLATRDWSTATDAGAEHRLTIHVWSRHAGKREALVIGSLVEGLLHDQPLALDDHALVNLRHELTEIRRDRDGITWHGVLRFRAVTEPAPGAA